LYIVGILVIATGRNLDRWIDFKSFQIFEESTTYTALQFFTKAPNQAIRVLDAPNGIIPDDPWADPSRALAYGREAFGERWLLLTGEERALIDRLYERCNRLDDPRHTRQIFQGLITSADAIYHLKRIGPGRYLCQQDGDPKLVAYEVEIEDALMKPLVSGTEAKRYIEPRTEIFLLFPYKVDATGARLIDEATVRSSYPKAWAYLASYKKSYKKELRFREAKRGKDGLIIEAPFDGDNWYRFGRHQNLDKQEIVKLVVPRLVANLGCSVDQDGSFYLDNVDVGGVTIADQENPFFIAGLKAVSRQLPFRQQAVYCSPANSARQIGRPGCGRAASTGAATSSYVPPGHIGQSGTATVDGSDAE